MCSNARQGDVKMITIMMTYADVAISTGDPVPAVTFYQNIANGF
jgi:hypothetical protein